MELQSSTRDCLCKTFRATGLPKDRAHSLVNEVEKWVRGSGIEWTVERLKSLHHWYITQLGGEPNIPSWVANKNGKPKGPFKWAFEMKNPQLALAILSCHTVFTNSSITPIQLKKLEDALRSKEVPNVISKRVIGKPKIPKLVYESPDLSCLTGISIPVGYGMIRLDTPRDRDKEAKAYMESWKWCPGETVRFIQSAKLLDHAPPIIESQSGSTRVPVGTLVCLQEPSLKARWISNPNRVTQHFMRPLQGVWADWLRKLPTDCTYDQNRGVLWAKDRLLAGEKLAATDLTSSTDKLNLLPCLDLVHKFCIGSRISTREDVEHWDKDWTGIQYLLAVNHFRDVSRGGWLRGKVIDKWEVGWPLGTAPSFSLLGLTNNIVAAKSARELGLDPAKSYRVVGDDIVMDARMLKSYERNINLLGGEFNPSKMIVSDKAVEFAGRVITPNGSYLKRVKSRDISDDSFMEIMSLMGEQAKSLLKPRQRRVWNELKYVPGVAVEGPFSQHAHGEQLSVRYYWALKHVLQEKIEPDVPTKTGGQIARDLALSLKSDLCRPGLQVAEFVAQERFIPRDLWEVNKPRATALNTLGGDPRRKNGKSTLQQMESLLEKERFTSFQVFKSILMGQNQPIGGEVLPPPAIHPPVQLKGSPRSQEKSGRSW